MVARISREATKSVANLMWRGRRKADTLPREVAKWGHGFSSAATGAAAKDSILSWLKFAKREVGSTTVEVDGWERLNEVMMGF